MYLFRQFSFFIYGAGSFRMYIFLGKSMWKLQWKDLLWSTGIFIFYHTEMLKYQSETQVFTSICWFNWFFFLNISSTSKGKKYQNFPLKYKMSMWPHSHCETVSVESSSNFQNSLKTFFLVTLTPQHFSEQRSTYLLHHTVEPPLFLL